MNLREISSAEVMNTDPHTVQNDISIAKAKKKMEENNLRAIVVVDSKNRVTGAIGYRDLIRHVQFNPDTSGLEKVMHQPPKFDKEDTLIDLAGRRINSGRKMLVNTQDDKLKGIVGDDEFREAFKEADEFTGLTTMDLGPNQIIQVFEDDSVEKARHKMLDNNISRLPVLDKDGNLTGIVTSTDMLKIIVSRESQSPDGTSGDTLKDTKIAGGSEKESMSHIQVSEIMDRTPLTVEGHVSGQEALENMSRNGDKEIIVVEKDYPETIVTVKDYIGQVAKMEKRRSVLVQLTGLDVPEEKAVVHEKIENQIRGSLGRKLDKPEEITVRIKKAEKDGKKHRYEVTMKLFSELGTTTVQSEAWDLLEVIDDCLQEMNRLIRDEKGKRAEH